MALEMRFGGNRNQTIALAVLGIILSWVLYTNYFSGPETVTNVPAAKTGSGEKVPVVAAPSVAASSVAAPSVAGVASAPAAAGAKKRTAPDRRAQEFRPRIGTARPEDRPDPMTVDPTLRLELLARLERVQITGGMRSLFDFSNMPSGPMRPEPKIIPLPVRAKPAPAFIGPIQKPPDPPVVAPPKPQAPPIPLKFYGFASSGRGGNRRAFFLDGDEILVGGEGELVKKRYKVIRIGLSNVTMEDTQFSQQQTLPIVPEGIGGA